MGDGYWNAQQAMDPSASLLKRPRTDHVADLPHSGAPSAQEMHNYLARNVDHGGDQIVSDAKTIGSAYDGYIHNAQLASFTSAEASNLGGVRLGSTVGGGIPALPIANPVGLGHPWAVGSDLVSNGRGIGFGGQLSVDPMARPGRELLPLPPDASNTIYIEGLPSNCTKREVAHIFRPFVGYKEVRLVSKESKHRGRDPLILGFVDFENPACAATALTVLQGYTMDESNPDSPYLRLEFSKYPGPRSGSGSRRRH